MNGPSKRALLSTLLSLVSLGGAIAARDEHNLVLRVQTIEDYVAQVDSMLPQYGPAMLNVPPGPNWMADLTILDVAQAVNAVPPSLVFEDGREILARDSLFTHFIKIDFDKGRVRWGDKGRGFNWEESPHTAIGEAEARLTAETIAAALGIPAGERAESDVTSRKGRHQTQGSFGPVFERERLVTIERLVNGYMVAGSVFRVAISNQGRPARLQVKWPRFVMPENLTLRARDQTVQIVASQLWSAFSGAELSLGFNLGYARYGFRYLPVVFVGASDTMSRTHLAVPLVITPPDRDADGIPDAADTCPETHDLHGEDSDADGVGDRCDNCPTLPNLDQLDVDGDGVGDACEMPEGACALPDTTCERLSREACALEQGVYAGDGTDCIGSRAAKRNVLYQTVRRVGGRDDAGDALEVTNLGSTAPAHPTVSAW